MAAQKSVLIVEDEVLIRVFLDDVFQEAGWEVTVASSGDEAIRLADQFDAVITDIQMPGSTDGVALSWKLYERKPTLPVVIMSGRALPQKSALPPSARFLAKPVPFETLLDLVTELVESSSSSR